MAEQNPLQAGVSHIHLLAHALHRIRATPPRLISSPPTQPRRAAVSLILHLRPPSNIPLPPKSLPPLPTLTEFFQQEWVNHPDTVAELLFIRREKGRDEAKGETTGENGHGAPSHVAFPGGRTEEGDEGALYTAMRQTWEEIGLDLAEREWSCVGQLDDREITTSLGKRLLMILSPFVFLHLSPYPPLFDPPEELSTTLHFISLPTLLSPTPQWSNVTIDISSRLSPKQRILRNIVRFLLGSMQFRALALHDREELSLWGLTLGMTLDLISYMQPPRPYTRAPPLSPNSDFEFVEGSTMSTPTMASVFPRFSYPDVNFWIWVFGKRYRTVLRSWEASLASSGSNDRRINWSGQALSTFYAAVRKALIVVIVGRALGILFGIGVVGWWVFSRRD